MERRFSVLLQYIALWAKPWGYEEGERPICRSNSCKHAAAYMSANDSALQALTMKGGCAGRGKNLLVLSEFPVRHAEDVIKVPQAQHVGQPLRCHSLNQMQIPSGGLPKEVNLHGISTREISTHGCRIRHESILVAAMS